MYYTTAVPTATRNSHKDNVRSSAVKKQLKQEKSNFQAQLHPLILLSSGLTCGSSTTPLLLISPGPAKASNFFVRVQRTSLLLISLGLWDKLILCACLRICWRYVTGWAELCLSWRHVNSSLGKASCRLELKPRPRPLDLHPAPPLCPLLPAFFLSKTKTEHKNTQKVQRDLDVFLLLLLFFFLLFFFFFICRSFIFYFILFYILER